MSRAEKVILTNMCMIEDDKGNVVMQYRSPERYAWSGFAFPGGHIEKGESLHQAITREVYEETGLTISNPKLTGIYHWMTGDVRTVGFLYKTDEYKGELISSVEGRVYWISGEEFLKKTLVSGMEQVWQMMHDDSASECLQTLTENGIVSKIQ